MRTNAHHHGLGMAELSMFGALAGVIIGLAITSFSQSRLRSMLAGEQAALELIEAAAFKHCTAAAAPRELQTAWNPQSVSGGEAAEFDATLAGWAPLGVTIPGLTSSSYRVAARAGRDLIEVTVSVVSDLDADGLHRRRMRSWRKFGQAGAFTLTQDLLAGDDL